MSKYLLYILLQLAAFVVMQEYGNFNLIVTKFSICKGPKTKDCATITSQIINNASIYAEVNVKENLVPTIGKVVASSLQSSEPLRLQLNKPCDNVYLKPLLGSMFNIKNKCEIQKGIYKISLNLQDMSHKYYGGKYFYGAWIFKASIYNSHCNLICTETELHFIPM